MERLLYPRSEIKIFNGVSISINRFTNGELTQKDQCKISAELMPLTGKGFLRRNLEDPNFVKDVNDHVIGTERLIVARKLLNNNPVSFIVSKKFEAFNINFYYLSGIIVDPSLQKSGLGRYLLVTDLLEANQNAIVLCTQSTKMRGLLRHVSNIDECLSATMAEFKFANSPYTRNKNIIKGLYVGSYVGGKSLYEDIAEFEKDAIKDVAEMDWREGDSIVLAGYLKPQNELLKEIAVL